MNEADPLPLPQVLRPQPEHYDRITKDLGPLLPVFEEGGIFLTGGYLARLACGLAVGKDIDVVAHVDRFVALRTAMVRAGFVQAEGETSTGFREGVTDGVWFREKWLHPEADGLDVDCLILQTGDYQEGAPMNMTEAAVNFLGTFDYHVGRQLLAWEQKEPVWFRTVEALDAIDRHVPGWVEGAFPTTEERKARWNNLLPGLPAARGGDNV